MAGLGALIFVAGLVGLIRPSWLRLKNRWWALGVMIVGLGLAGAGAGDELPTEPAQQTTQADVTETAPAQEEPASESEDEAAADPEPATEPAVTPTPGTQTQEDAPAQPEPSAGQHPEQQPAETVSQRNAVRKAQEYLRVMPFSKKELIEQLEFEGFSTEDATYAVNKLDVDWKEQAVRKGKIYLAIMGFSRSGLIEQLEFDGFSTEEATYAADQLGF